MPEEGADALARPGKTSSPKRPSRAVTVGSLLGIAAAACLIFSLIPTLASHDGEGNAAQVLVGMRNKAEGLVALRESQRHPQLDVAAISVIHASSEEVTAGRHAPVLIGDSVPGDAEWMGTFPDALVDCAISRRPDQALELCRSYAAQGILGNVVVLASFSNTTATPEELDAMIEAIGTDRAIYLVGTVNPDGFQDEANTNLIAVADAYDRVSYVDWPAVCAGHEAEYLWADMTHLRPEGGIAYVDMVKRAIAQAMVDAGGSVE